MFQRAVNSSHTETHGHCERETEDGCSSAQPKGAPEDGEILLIAQLFQLIERPANCHTAKRVRRFKG